MTNLSLNFTLDELTKTNTGLSNIPSKAETEKLFYLCQYILQPIRDHWGALIITSGFRSVPVNVRIGGSPTSQHVLGEAVDFYPHGNIDNLDDVFEWIVKESGLKFGQCISEEKERNGAMNNWVHISLVRNLPAKNNEALIFKNGVYSPLSR